MPWTQQFRWLVLSVAWLGVLSGTGLSAAERLSETDGPVLPQDRSLVAADGPPEEDAAPCDDEHCEFCGRSFEVAAACGGCPLGCGQRLAFREATLLPAGNLLDGAFQSVLGVKQRLGFPLEVAAWHWFPIDTTGAGAGGYGLQNYRGTYAYTLRGGPEYQLSDTQTVGAYAYFALRDGDPYRTYYPSNAWFLESYAWYRTAELGTLKGGLIFNRFGLGSYGNFIGTAPYFEGYIQDPDYGVSWENTWNVRDDLAIDTYVQYFMHEDSKNGSLANFDSESVAGITERNTAVLRGLAKYTFSETSRLELGSSFLVGQIDSTLPGFADDTRTVWGVDLAATHGKLAFKTEFLQRFGRVVPNHFVSGGPSDRMEAYSTELSYHEGPLTYRGKFSQSFLSNPNARQNILSLGGQLDITANVHFFAEYVWWNVNGHAVAGDFTVIEGPQLTVYWHY